MCGIAGFSLTGDDDRVAEALIARLCNRGPDRNWSERSGSYGLVQTRLSVIDLSEQVTYPIRNENGDLLLLFNGEIYDHEAHRRQLERRGHRFRTHCDAEVVVHGFEEYGTSVFARLDGMFALALLHLPTGELILARDAAGIKPLVYTTSERFAFASEAMALVAAGLSDGDVDHEAIGAYLHCHYVPPPLTGVRGVRQLLPGELLRRDSLGRVTTELWRRPPFTVEGRAEIPTVADAERALDESVRSQLAADVPVGVFLSSGLDSSLVLDSAIRSGARPTAFTIGFPEQRDYDEAAAAARFARDLGVEHVVGTLSLGFADTVNDVCSAFDAPFADASAIATLQLARLARSRVTVALSGTGGDDLFAGYYRHRAHLLQPWLDRVPPAVARIGTKLAAGYGADSRSPLGTARNYLARLAATHRTEPLAQYLALMTSTSSEVAWSLTHAAPWTTRGALSEGGAARGGSVLRQIQAIELQTYVPGDLLTKEDRATMAVGLEARVPLLSNLMIEVAERAEDRQKLRLGGGKLMLREVGRRRLPAYLTSGRKRGFAVPLRDLFAGRWRAETIEWLGGASSSLVECDRAAQLVALNGLRPTDIWALTVLTGWEVSLRAARLESQRLRLS